MAVGIGLVFLEEKPKEGSEQASLPRLPTLTPNPNLEVFLPGWAFMMRGTGFSTVSGEDRVCLFQPMHLSTGCWCVCGYEQYVLATGTGHGR